MVHDAWMDIAALRLCHDAAGYLETPVFASTLQEAAPDELFKSDIHNQLGITCGDCHKDNPQPEKREVAALCARCHSDLNYMRRFNPQMRVDQFAEYQTSVHGMRNARGDENVATVDEPGDDDDRGCTS